MSAPHPSCAGCGIQIVATFQLSFSPSGRAYVCRSCRHWHLGFPSTPACCRACGNQDLYEKDMDQALCPDCTKKLEDADDIVRKGGIYWSCSGCGWEGVLNPDHPISTRLRTAYRVAAPDPLVLNLERCPHCQEAQSERVDTATT